MKGTSSFFPSHVSFSKNKQSADLTDLRINLFAYPLQVIAKHFKYYLLFQKEILVIFLKFYNHTTNQHKKVSGVTLSSDFKSLSRFQWSLPVNIFWKAVSTFVESNADVSINDNVFFSEKAKQITLHINSEKNPHKNSLV